MQIHTFIANTAAEAVAQIREQLGNDAVVLNVRKLPGEGFSRLWQKPRIEVLAHLPVMTPAAPLIEPATEALTQIRVELADLKRCVWEKQENAKVESEMQESETENGNWRVEALLKDMGLLPLNAQRVVEQLRVDHGDLPPETLAEEIEMMRVVFDKLWRQKKAPASNTHIFIGPAGAGKTTSLCKWLTQTVLLEERLARVWRLDGATANTAESLSVYAEILGVPVERSASSGDRLNPSELLFIDLPGVNWNDAAAVRALAERLKLFPSAQIHLVLNAAYETSLLQAQARAFGALPVTDLIFTHLDEEGRWGKIWNLILGTNFSAGFFSAGQNIPGDFFVATPDKLLERQFPRKCSRISQPAAAKRGVANDVLNDAATLTYA